MIKNTSSDLSDMPWDADPSETAPMSDDSRLLLSNGVIPCHVANPTTWHRMTLHNGCQHCEMERLRAQVAELKRQLELQRLLEGAMADCIGPRDGQTFEQRAEELIVTEVQHQHCSSVETSAPCYVGVGIYRGKGEIELTAAGCNPGMVLYAEIDQSRAVTGSAVETTEVYTQEALDAAHAQTRERLSKLKVEDPPENGKGDI